MTTEAALWLLCAFFVAACIALAVENAALRRHLETTYNQLDFARRMVRESSRVMEEEE